MASSEDHRLAARLGSDILAPTFTRTELLPSLSKAPSTRSSSDALRSGGQSLRSKTSSTSPPRNTGAQFEGGSEPLPRLSTETRRSVSFANNTSEGVRNRGPDMGRKAKGAEEAGMSSADEEAPIIRREAGGRRKDYQSISPSIAAKDHTGGSGAEGHDNPVAENAAAASKKRGERRDDVREAEQAAAETERREKSWWRVALDRYGSVELENKGSVARDHLALERTFLAWLRTSLSFASIGIAITQLFRLNTTIVGSDPPSSDSGSPKARLRHVGKPLGATFIAISILVLFIGFHRYFESQHYVIRGKFPASRGSILVVAFVAGALIVSSLVVILAVAPQAFEK